MACLEHLLKQSPIEIYPTRIPKAPDFWQPAMWSVPRLITNNQPVTDDALEIIGEMLRFTQGGRFYCGLEQLKTFCQPQTLAAFAQGSFHRVATSWCSRKRQLGISGVKSLWRRKHGTGSDDTDSRTATRGQICPCRQWSEYTYSDE